MKKYIFSLEIIVALLFAVAFGKLLPQGAVFYKLLGSWFINGISLIIVPLIFTTVVLSIVKTFAQGTIGKLLVKSLIYFFLVTTAIILIFLLLPYYLHFGGSLPIAKDLSAIKGLSSKIDIWAFLTAIVPTNIFAAFSANSLLPVIFIALIFGLGLKSVPDEKAAGLLSLLESIKLTLENIIAVLIKLSPIGIFGILASSMKSINLSTLSSLILYVGGLYAAYLALALIIFPILSVIFRVDYLETWQEIKDLFAVTFFSGSSSVVLPNLLERLKNRGADPVTTDLVLPLGYVFNLQGAAVYLSVTVAFLSNSYHIQLSLATLLTYVLYLTLVSKTIATIPSGAVVVLIAISSQLGLPAQGIALVFAVDFFANAGRSALNVWGNALTIKILEKGKTKNV